MMHAANSKGRSFLVIEVEAAPGFALRQQGKKRIGRQRKDGRETEGETGRKNIRESEDPA